jgi:hypothetical protein
MEDVSTDYLIDGIGNDVTILIACIVVLISLVLAWMSTHVQPIQNQQAQYQNNLNRQEQVSTPVVETTSPESTAENNSDGASNLSSSQDSSSTQSPPPTSPSSKTSKEKGSSSSASGPSHRFSLRLKFLDDTQQLIQCSSNDKIRDLRHNFPSETAHRYRLIFGGQVLRDDRTLEQYGIRRQLAPDNSEIIPVIHCFLSNSPEPRRGPTSASDQIQQNVGELHMGHFFLPLLGSMLTMLWYICIFHTSLFTVPSIFGIVGLTCFYAIILVNRFL